MDAVGAFCRERGIWFHVDDAHGAAALLSPRHAPMLRGIAAGDSIVWVPTRCCGPRAFCAAVLVREARRLDTAFQQKASYLIYGDEEVDAAGPDLLGRQVECTKAPLGGKTFMNLAFRGERGLGKFVAQQYDKTLRFWELISSRDGFQCLCRPEANILCSRYGDDRGCRWGYATAWSPRGASSSAQPRFTVSAG